MNTAIKYKRTYHFPFSLGLQNDDKMMEDVNCFDGKTIAVTIKMDGENTSMYSDGLHARSLSSAHHPSRTWVKSLHATIKNDIPEGWRICGENMYAKHSIHYTDLESYFYVFSVWNEKNECLNFKDTSQFCWELGLTHVQTVGVIILFEHEQMTELERIYKETIAKGHEGIVVRNVDSFHYDEFQQNVAKAVRPNHIQTGAIHWASAPVIPNLLKETLR